MKRTCPCGARVAPWNYARHRRGDACSARPLPCPERCSCGWPWPCDRCALGPLVARYVTKHDRPGLCRRARYRLAIEYVALITGLPQRTVYREVHCWERMMRGGRPKRSRRTNVEKSVEKARFLAYEA